MSGLPKGWVGATLGDLTQSLKNGIYKPAEAYNDDGVPCLRMYNIEQGFIVWKDIKRMELSPDEVSEYALLPGDILVNRVNSRELVGKSALITEGLGACVFESKNIRLRPDSRIADSAFLNYELLSGGRAHFSENAQQVVGMASISQGQVAAFPVDLPPLPEQRRIVAKIEALMARSRAAREALADIPALLDRYRQSVLASAFHGEHTKDWGQVSFEEVTEFVTSGSRGWGDFYSENGPLFIRVGNFDRFSVDLNLANVSHVRPPEGAEGPRTKIRANDVMITITADVGMVGVASVNLGEAYVNQHVALCRPKGGINPRFLAYTLMDPIGLQKLVQEIQYGATKASLSLVQVRNFPIPLPPQKEQEAIVNRLDEMLSQCRSIETMTIEHFGLSGQLDQSILAKAFRGELVPQDPSDDPAEVLLARIRGSREAQGPPARRRGRPAAAPAPVPAPRPVPAPVALDRAAEEIQADAADAPARVDLEALDTDVLMAAFRQTLATQGSWDTDEDLLRALAQRFGYQRLGSRAKETLKGHLRAALQRRIAVREMDGTLALGPRALDAYTRDELIDYLPSVLRKGQSLAREDLMRALLHHLGFQRLTDAAQEALKSALNLAIRRGVLQAGDGDQIWRIP